MAEYELLEGKRVLLVDDEPDVLDTLEDLLSMCQTVKAASFEEAKEKGKNPWVRWFDRMASFFEKKFGKDWQASDKDFWEKFPFY